MHCIQVDVAVKTSTAAREVMRSIPGPVELDAVDNGSPLLRRFLVAQTLNCGDGAATRSLLRRKTAIIMKI